MSNQRPAIGHNPWFRFSSSIRNVMMPGCSHKTVQCMEILEKSLDWLGTYTVKRIHEAL